MGKVVLLGCSHRFTAIWLLQEKTVQHYSENKYFDQLETMSPFSLCNSVYRLHMRPAGLWYCSGVEPTGLRKTYCTTKDSSKTQSYDCKVTIWAEEVKSQLSQLWWKCDAEFSCLQGESFISCCLCFSETWRMKSNIFSLNANANANRGMYR